MNNTEARRIARNLMDAHGLKDWHLDINTNKSRLGVCMYWRKTIGISSFFFNQGEDVLRDTILHEIAHAIAGHAAGHGDAWKSVATRIGANPERTADVKLQDSDFAWVGKCPCGRSTKRNHRRPANLNGWQCRICGEGLAWTHKGVPFGQPVKRDHWAVAAQKISEHRAQKPTARPNKTGRGRGPYDRGFTDIEALWAD